MDAAKIAINLGNSNDLMKNLRNSHVINKKIPAGLKEEGNETVTNCHQLKMRAADGKMRLTDVAESR